MINCSIYERIFKRFDEDGDGKLYPSELRRCVETIGEELLMEEAQEVVESMDSDGDGLVGLEEFVG
ncbi:Polcalcin Ole e 3 [Vitis vinifera]|uniref:Polcalcin Ole e 3 n=1 Tax=Vitis vinifera TaxID=29760 RepID=A0A438FS54_VITVI|nr:Polcalcin Ole e 3 [Vitis vinifera]